MVGGDGLPTVSVVVPTLNEDILLPCLLDALAAQTLPPNEVVVADAGSDDDTVLIARRAGALVVAGGLPAAARNAGAAASTGDLVLFLDADVRPDGQFLERAVGEFLKRRLDVATAPLVPADRDWDFRLVYAVIARWLQWASQTRPHAVGACILVRRTMHDRLGGFDETLALAEDHDYARRAAQAGRFGVLRSVRIPTSMRRIRHLGRLSYGWISLVSEVRSLLGRPARRVPEGYDLGGDPVEGSA
ncbi:MAG TPA: glycosyltransferase [Arachnia sp.]|nr:glycosyltransferase [Arachnia sp.]